jgi:hypothetical protein
VHPRRAGRHGVQGLPDSGREMTIQIIDTDRPDLVRGVDPAEPAAGAGTAARALARFESSASNERPHDSDPEVDLDPVVQMREIGDLGPSTGVAGWRVLAGWPVSRERADRGESMCRVI